MNKVFLSVSLLIFSFYAMAQDEIVSPVFRVHFRIGTAVIDSDFSDNATTIERLKAALDSSNLRYIKCIRLSGTTSPDGPFAVNQALSASRLAAIKSYIADRNPDISSAGCVEEEVGINWKGLRRLVEADLNTPMRTEILHIIDNVPEVDFKRNVSRNKSLMSLGVKSWNYISEHHFPALRSSTAVIVYARHNTPQERIEHIDTIVKGEATDGEPSFAREAVAQAPDTTPFVRILQDNRYHVRRPFALKTNLLFDLSLLLNTEIELPLSPRWSVATELMFPWWLSEEKQRCLQVVQGSLEVRYWLSRNYARQDPRLGMHNPLSGWFVGLYGGGGYYDIEWNRRGYQGEFFVATGISMGYVKPIGDNLSLEFSLGVGVLKTNYRHYEAQQDNQGAWHLYRAGRGAYTWVGPTKLKVSLAWYPHFFTSKKGGRHR